MNKYIKHGKSLKASYCLYNSHRSHSLYRLICFCHIAVHERVSQNPPLTYTCHYLKKSVNQCLHGDSNTELLRCLGPGVHVRLYSVNPLFGCPLYRSSLCSNLNQTPKSKYYTRLCYVFSKKSYFYNLSLLAFVMIRLLKILSRCCKHVGI